MIICEILLFILIFDFLEIKIHHVWNRSFKLALKCTYASVAIILFFSGEANPDPLPL